MGKYDRLCDYLPAWTAGIGEMTLTLDEMTALAGPFPHSARDRPPRWPTIPRDQVRVCSPKGWGCEYRVAGRRDVRVVRGWVVLRCRRCGGCRWLAAGWEVVGLGRCRCQCGQGVVAALTVAGLMVVLADDEQLGRAGTSDSTPAAIPNSPHLKPWTRQNTTPRPTFAMKLTSAGRHRQKSIPAREI